MLVLVLLAVAGAGEATRVSVRLVDAQGEAIEGAVFGLSGEGGVLQGEAPQTGALRPGTYHLQAKATGFETLEADLQIPAKSEHEIVQRLVSLPVKMTIKFVDPQGKTVEGEFSLGSLWSRTTNGKSQIDLQPGEGKLLVRVPGYRSQTIPFAIDPGDSLTVNVELVPSAVAVTPDRIELKGSVYFDTNQATIKKESHPLLDDVVDVMKSYPEIQKIRIEGHTDARGDAKANLDLSARRAASVLKYLVDHGVAASRATSVGYGEDMPIAKGDDEAAWEKNRRVEIHIVQRAG
jgi:outer membrane protein OmpA-like peptidoglycan-associated protein